MTDTVMTGTGGFQITPFGGLMSRFEEARKAVEAVAPHPGIKIYPLLHSSPPDGSRPRVREAFVEFAPGSRYPVPDRHDDSPEILVVVDGLMDDKNGTHPPGTLIYGPRGSSHHPGTSGGCIVYAFFPDR
ncbi:cupin domain-containing protein [Streptomyces niveus]|uniref:cupin domain-containing protein n=1 Tax=Streptomyces niveus TaxID=193462 RepID=UPI0036A997AA